MSQKTQPWAIKTGGDGLGYYDNGRKSILEEKVIPFTEFHNTFFDNNFLEAEFFEWRKNESIKIYDQFSQEGNERISVYGGESSFNEDLVAKKEEISSTMDKRKKTNDDLSLFGEMLMQRIAKSYSTSNRIKAIKHQGYFQYNIGSPKRRENGIFTINYGIRGQNILLSLDVIKTKEKGMQFIVQKHTMGKIKAEAGQLNREKNNNETLALNLPDALDIFFDSVEALELETNNAQSEK